MASVNSQPKTRVEQDIENWKKQQLLLGNKGGVPYGNGSNSVMNTLLFASGLGSSNGQNYQSQQAQSNSNFDQNNSLARKKRRRKRSKNNKQRIKSFLSSSSGGDDQMNESMIESCSSPDYSMQERELGKDFFFEQQQTNSQAILMQSQMDADENGNGVGMPPSAEDDSSRALVASWIPSRQEQNSLIEKLRQTLKETGHIIVMPERRVSSQDQSKTR